MRRKSERAKKPKDSPEKPEKPKKSRTARRRKASSSEVESEDESSSQVTDVIDNVPPSEGQGVESQSDEKVWQVKSDDSGSGAGEIKKLKICLSTRTPLTPEPEATPRSRRKLNRTISDTPSEGTEKHRSRHKARRSTRESRESTAPETYSEDEDPSNKKLARQEHKESLTSESETAASKISDSVQPELAIEGLSTQIDSISQETIEDKSSENTEENESKVAPLTPIAKCRRSRRLSGSSPQREPSPEKIELEKLPLISEEVEQNQTEVQTSQIVEDSENNHDNEEKSNNQKEEILQVCNKSEQKQITNEQLMPNDTVENEIVDSTQQNEQNEDHVASEPILESDVSKSIKSKSPENFESQEKSPQPICSDENESESTLQKSSPQVTIFAPQEPLKESSELDEVLETSNSRRNKHSCEKEISHNSLSNDKLENNSNETYDIEEHVPKSSEELVETYNATPIIVSRKRRWGTRVNKSERPVSISTDILKDIIPDVKPAELEEAIEDKRQRRKSENLDKPKVDRPILPKIVIDNSENANYHRRERVKEHKEKIDTTLTEHRKISIVKEDNFKVRPPSPARHKTSSVLFITNLVRPFTLAQLKNLLQRTGKIVSEGFWIDRIKSKCFVTYENEEQAVETRHALHGVTWPVSNPKTLQVDFSSQEALERMRAAEEQVQEKVTALPGTVEDWLREQDAKKEKFADVDAKPRDKRNVMREWDVGKNEKDKERMKKEERPLEKYRIRADERSPEPARKLKRKEEEPPAKMLDDLFRKTKTVPCIYWLPLSAETIAVKEEQRRQHMAEHERRMQELERSRTHRRH